MVRARRPARAVTPATLAITVGLTVGLTVGVAGCDPEITGGAYLCGPQMACPSDYVCDPLTAECVRPSAAQPFACVDGSEGGEPNEAAAQASALPLAGCPASQVERLGCIPAPSDADWFAVTASPACAGAPLSIDVRYATAFAPVFVDLMAADGVTVIATAQPCGIAGQTGPNDAVCLDTTVPADGRALVRVTIDESLDCQGACDFTSYSVTASADAP